ncbi:MAG: DUF4271 domain-containing protein [Bacteroidales bacterium]|nr:DUF4271 domain-containing protein [Bacteroidales bacterium]
MDDTTAIVKQQDATFVNYLLAPDTAASKEWQPLSFDSVFAAHAVTEPVRHRSLFESHTLAPTHDVPLARPSYNAPGWIFCLLLVMAALISLYFNTYRLRLGNVIRSALQKREMEHFVRDNNFRRRASILPMLLLYSGSISLAACRFYPLPTNPWHGIGLYLGIFALLSVWLLFKNGLIRLLGNIFENDASAALYVANNYIYQLLASILTAPIVLLSFFAPWQPATGSAILIAVATFFVIRTIRGMQLILTNAKNSQFYLFYYLCILEFVPLLVAWKTFISM